jgi:hypothetical protein
MNRNIRVIPTTDLQNIADHPDVVTSVLSLAMLTLDRYKEKILSESIDAPDSPMRLLLMRARMDGMKELIRELHNNVTQAKRS